MKNRRWTNMHETGESGPSHWMREWRKDAMTRPETEHAANGHPDPEELAAFIDGGLPEAEAARVRAHLGRCEDCYEVFLEVVRFQRESGTGEQEPEATVRPFPPSRTGGHRPRVAALTALAACLAGLLGLAVYRGMAQAPVSEPTARLAGALVEKAPALVGETWPRATRGDDGGKAPGGDRSFRLGVEAVNLYLAVQADNREKARDAARRTEDLLAGSSTSGGELSIYGSLAAGAGLSRTEALAQLAEAERALRERLQGSSRLEFSFGRWAEAGYLAALASEPQFFARPETRRLLRRFREESHLRHADEIAGPLRRIDDVLTRKTLTGRDYEVLAHELAKVLAAYYDP